MIMEPTSQPSIYGLMAEFDTPAQLIEAARRVRAEGYHRVEAYTPYPIEELSHVLHPGHSRLPLLVFCGGVIGGICGYLLQYWVHVVHYPINIGGKPLHSWPAFIPITFEMTILGAALTTVLGMLALNGLPMPYHPVFNVPRFSLASRDRFFMMIRSVDPHFDRQRTEALLTELEAHDVVEVMP
jgi:ActD protein